MDFNALIAHTNVQARPYQGRIVTKVVDLFGRQGLRSILIESPTGSGKTVMGLLAARALQQQLGLRVGWVAMRRYLLAQAEAENGARAIDLQATFLSMFDRDPATGLDLLVVDEAQHDAAQSMTFIHQRVRPRYILGLSATPFRADKVKLCFDSVVRDAGIQTLIQDGYLSPYTHYTVPRHSPADVAACYLREPQRWGRSLVYFHTVEQCARAHALFQEGGVRSAVVTGGSDRDSQLEDFRAGRIDVLLNCMVLAEGFDCPELQTVFCRPSGKGVTIQMAGRVLRQHAAVPVKQIVQCQKTRWPFVRTAAAAYQYVWDGNSWKSLTVNPFINQVNNRTLQALARTNVVLPEFLVNRGFATGKDEAWWRRGE
jgi:superfamily II DNA or RNA helicase